MRCTLCFDLHLFRHPLDLLVQPHPHADQPMQGGVGVDEGVEGLVAFAVALGSPSGDKLCCQFRRFGQNLTLNSDRKQLMCKFATPTLLQRACFGPNLAVGIAFGLLKIGLRTLITNYWSDTQLCGRPSLGALRSLRAVNFQGVMPISFALAAIGAGIVDGWTDWDADCGLRQRGDHDPDHCEVDMG
ncbi:MAG: hypothetical protein Q8Q26_07485 [Pseudorhodobacter sp.]|nr:hypothetical protein [Pseudorhodobacter sp.]